MTFEAKTTLSATLVSRLMPYLRGSASAVVWTHAVFFFFVNRRRCGACAWPHQMRNNHRPPLRFQFRRTGPRLRMRAVGACLTRQRVFARVRYRKRSRRCYKTARSRTFVLCGDDSVALVSVVFACYLRAENKADAGPQGGNGCFAAGDGCQRYSNLAVTR